MCLVLTKDGSKTQLFAALPIKLDSGHGIGEHDDYKQQRRCDDAPEETSP
jgi:hypothetical protein